METKSLGQNIQALRQERNLSLDELSSKLKISSEVLSDWERDYGGPNGDQMMQLVDVFNVSYNEIAGRVNKTVWSKKDIALMTNLWLGIFLLFQKLIVIDKVGYTFFEIIKLFGQSLPLSIAVLLLLVFTSLSLYLIVRLFLSIQNPSKYKFHGLTKSRVCTALLLLSTILFRVVGFNHFETTISATLIDLSALATFVIYIYNSKA